MTWKVLIPISLGELKEVQIVLHLALDQRFHRDNPINSMLFENVCNLGQSCVCPGALPLGRFVSYFEGP